MKNFNKGIIAGLGSLLCFSIILILGIKVYDKGVSPLGVLTFRAFSAGLLFFLVILLSKKISFKIEKKDIGRLVLHSSILTGHLILFWQGLKIIRQIPVAYALYFTFPMFVFWIAVFFLKEKINKMRVLSLTLGLVGVLFAIKFLPTMSLAEINLLGVIIMLFASLAWAIYILLGQVLLKKYHLFTILFYNFLFGLIAFFLLQNPITTISQITVTISVLFYIIIMGVVSTFLAYLLYYFAIKKIKASNMSIVSFASPLFTSLCAFLFLRQTMTLFQILGMILLVLGIYLLHKEYE